jgi:hypothetical protein
MFAKNKTVAAVMKSFHTAIQELGAVADTNRAREAALQEEIFAREMERDACADEAKLADRVAAKLRGVIEG